MVESPTPPAWRVSEVSAILHAAGAGVDRGTSDGIMADAANLFTVSILSVINHFLPNPEVSK
jgi:hypothetical protein